MFLLANNNEGDNIEQADISAGLSTWAPLTSQCCNIATSSQMVESYLQLSSEKSEFTLIVRNTSVDPA
jgi:hypothetical protein